MKQLVLTIAAVLTLGGAIAVTAADAQPPPQADHHDSAMHRDHGDRGGSDHDRGRHHGWDHHRGWHHGWRHHHRVCRTVWHHHHRIRTCHAW